MTSAQTVRELALEQPGSIRVFEQLGIDYCCGGRKPLAEACAALNLSVEEVLARIEAAENPVMPPQRDWRDATLASLIDHIERTHHVYVRTELPRLEELAARVLRRHGEAHPELPALQQDVLALQAELLSHLQKEELILFPFIRKMEKARTTGEEAPSGCFTTVRSPIQAMIAEHDNAGDLLAEMRRLSGNYTTPDGACPTWHAFYDGLREFEQDLHQHIHLENNLLFPRAIAMEASAGG